MQSYYFLILCGVWMVFVASLAQQASAQHFSDGDKPLYFDKSCLDGEIPNWFRHLYGTTYDGMCVPDRTCDDQAAQTRSIEFQSYCQGSLIVRCLEQDETDPCLLPLIDRFRSDASHLAFTLGQRLAENDLSVLPKLLKRRLTNLSLLTAGAFCDTDVNIKYLEQTYGVSPDVYCAVDRSKRLRTRFLNHHFTLDRYHISR